MFFFLLYVRVYEIGRTFLQMHVTEQKWDKVKSNRTLRSSVAHATATDKLAKVARSVGVDEVMRWKAASVSLLSSFLSL
jgi:hypothetical protein